MRRLRHLLTTLPVTGLLVTACLATVVAAVAQQGRSPRPTSFDWWILLVFATVIAIGEINRIALPGAREQAPMALAAAFGLAMTSEVWDGNHVMVGADTVVLTTAVGMLAGAALSRARGVPIRTDDLSTRFLAVAVAAWLFRGLPAFDGRTLLQLQDDWVSERWLSAVSMLAVSVVALFTQSVLVALQTAASTHRRFGRAVLDELTQAAGLSTALAASGALIALAERPMGWVALPVFLVPLVLTQFAVRRFASIRRTYGQTIRTLSRMSDIGGYTLPDHAARVSSLGVAMGGDLGMSERDTLDLEYAALLHDIGQVALREPIPGGATTMAAPADQDRIARDGAHIVRQTGVLDEVARILEMQAKPYRHVRELGEDLPMASRIIKVANAYDDLVGDPASPEVTQRRDNAVERMHLGLGYEYDPRVVEALDARNSPAQPGSVADSPASRGDRAAAATSIGPIRNASGLLGLPEDLGDLVDLGEQLVSHGDVERRLGAAGAGELGGLVHQLCSSGYFSKCGGLK